MVQFKSCRLGAVVALCLTVQACGGGTSSQTTTPPNDNNPPAQIALSGPEQVNEQTTVTITSQVISPDTISQYSWTQVSGPTVAIAQSNSSELSFTTPTVLIFDGPQTLTFKLSVTTTDNQSATAEYTTTVMPVNEAPQIELVSTEIKEGRTSTVKLNLSDDGTISDVQWQQLSGPTVEIVSTTQTSLTFIPPTVVDAQSITFRATATDNEQQSSELEVTESIENMLQFSGKPQALIDSQSITLKPHSPIYADWDKDGDIDIIAIQHADATAPAIYWYKNQGDGTFALPPVKLATIVNSDNHDSPATLAKLDINLDGTPEVIVGGYAGKGVGWIDLTEPQTPQVHWIDETERKIVDVTTADVNGDGVEDIVINANRVIYWYANQGAGQFAAPVQLAIVPSNPIGVRKTQWLFEDLDHDGKLDFAMASYADNLKIHWGLGNGQFEPAQLIAESKQPTAIFATDFNLDGKTDLLVTDNGLNDIHYYLSQQSRQYQAHMIDDTRVIANADMQDINQDGVKELIVIDRTGRPNPNNPGEPSNGNTIFAFSGIGTSAFKRIGIAYAVGAYDSIDVVNLDQDDDLEIALSLKYKDQFYYLDASSLPSGYQQKAITLSKQTSGFSKVSTTHNADIDGDGHEDFLAAGVEGIKLWQGPISPNTLPDATLLFSKPRTYFGYDHLALIDSNLDGKKDIVAASYGEINLYQQLSSAPLGFASEQSLYKGTNTQNLLEYIDYMAAIDVASDKQAIIAISRHFSYDPDSHEMTQLSLILRRFLKDQPIQEIAISDAPGERLLLVDAKVADLNLDGADDIILTLLDGSNTLTVNTYLSSFEQNQWRITPQHQTTFANGNLNQRPMIGDFNGNGRMDLIIEHVKPNSTWETQWSFFFNSEQGIFNAAADMQLDSLCARASVIDMDNDNDDDLFCYGPGKIISLENPGNGSFSQSSEQHLDTMGIYGNPKIHLFDIDGDSDKDIVLPLIPHNTLAWGENQWH